MANEVTGVVQFRCLNGGFDTGQISTSLGITQSAQGAAMGTVVPATTGTALPTSGVTTYGLLYLKNLDGSINVTFGSTLYEFTLRLNEPFFGRPTASALLFLKAASGAPKVQYIFLND